MSHQDKLAALEAAIDKQLDQLTESITATEKRIADEKRRPAGPPPDRPLSTLTRTERIEHLRQVQAHAASLPPAEARAAVAKFKRLREEHKALSAEEKATGADPLRHGRRGVMPGACRSKRVENTGTPRHVAK